LECPGGGFFNVSVTVIADEAFRPRWLHLVHPRAGGLATRFHNVPGQVIAATQECTG
jgi:hypothetical protein